MLDFLILVTAGGIRMAIPFLLSALGELMAEQSGVRNLGLEGIIQASCFGSFCVSFLTGNSWLGLLAGASIGLIFGILSAFTMIRLGVNQLIMGVMITVLGGGMASYLYDRFFSNVIISPIKGFTNLSVPGLFQIPFLGSVLFNQNLLVYLAIFCVPLFSIFLYRTTLGLKIRAVGMSPKAADSVGVDVYRLRYLTVILGSIMAGLAGSYLVLADLKWFTHGMSAGRGWISLGIVIFGRWSPGRVLCGSLLFGLIYSLQFYLQSIQSVVPYQFLLMLPYLVIVITLVLSRQESGKPTALGTPYQRNA